MNTLPFLMLKYGKIDKVFDLIAVAPLESYDTCNINIVAAFQKLCSLGFFNAFPLEKYYIKIAFYFDKRRNSNESSCWPGVPNTLTMSGLNALVVPEPTKLPAIKTMVFTNKNKRPSSAGPQDTKVAKKSKLDVITIIVEVVKDSSDELGARSVRMEHSSETVGTENQKVTKQCPVADCNYILKRRVLKHVYAVHLPDLFSNRMVGKLDEAKLPQARLHALVSLIKRSLGAEVDLEQAELKINDSGLIHFYMFEVSAGSDRVLLRRRD